MQFSETTKKSIEKLVVLIIGMLTVIITDRFADFRGVAATEQKIEQVTNYSLSIDSVYKVSSELEKEHKRKEAAVFIKIKQMIANDEKLTVEAIKIAEDTIFTTSAYQRDSIMNIMLKE